MGESMEHYEREILSGLVAAIEDYNQQRSWYGNASISSNGDGTTNIHVEGFHNSEGVQVQIACQKQFVKGENDEKEAKDTPLFETTRKVVIDLLEDMHLQEDKDRPENELPQKGHYHYQLHDEPDFILLQPGNQIKPTIKEITVNADDLGAILKAAQDKLAVPVKDAQVAGNELQGRLDSPSVQKSGQSY